MSEKQLAKSDERLMEYVPFGAQDKIKLSVAIVRDLIAVKTKSGKEPSERDCIKFMMMCQARALNPFEGDAFLIGYDGREGATFSLITAHQAFLKRAEVNDQYDGMESGIVVEREGQLLDIQGDFYSAGEKVRGGWARVFFKNRSYPMYKRIRMERFKKPFGIWLDDDAGMICKCAEADALRSSFPTMLGGLYIREEIDTESHFQPQIMRPVIGNVKDGSGGSDAQTTGEGSSLEPTSSSDFTGDEKSPAPEPKKKPSKKLKKKEVVVVDERPNETALRKRLERFGISIEPFRKLAIEQEWIPHVAAISDVPDDDLAPFLEEENWKLVIQESKKL